MEKTRQNLTKRKTIKKKREDNCNGITNRSNSNENIFETVSGTVPGLNELNNKGNGVNRRVVLKV